MKFVLVLASFVFVGCSLLPGARVTKERCESFDMKEWGTADGLEGNRKGAKIEFWDKDCRAVGVRLNRDIYDLAYTDGVKSYCSCEKGFEIGMKSEFAELQGQNFACVAKELKEFNRGFEASKKFKEDDSLRKRVSEFKVEYVDEAITAKAVQVCKKK